MTYGPELLLVGAVAAVGVLHTMVPDHWVPIALIARQRGWSKGETARASLQAGAGHVLSTLLIALIIWLAGVAFARRFGSAVDTVSSLALIAFGGWIAIAAWRDMRRHGGHGHAHSHDVPHIHGHEHGPGHGGHAHDHARGDDHGLAPADDPLYVPSRGETAVLMQHIHLHRHGRSIHAHWHDHVPASFHAIAAETDSAPPAHEHRHKTTGRAALLLILGSSPMVEGIPAFFAAGKYGAGLIAVMASVFAISTIATYMFLCVYSAAGLQHMKFGALERYGEVLSGGLIALVGLAFWIWPIL